jgi:hypothetical protein
MNNPLHHVGQTAGPEASHTADEQSGDAGAPARQQNQTDKTPRGAPGSAGSNAGGSAQQGSNPGEKHIRPLQPGEPPPESSAGS